MNIFISFDISEKFDKKIFMQGRLFKNGNKSIYHKQMDFSQVF